MDGVSGGAASVDGRSVESSRQGRLVVRPGKRSPGSTQDMTPYFGPLYRLLRCSLPLNIRHKLVLDDPAPLIAFRAGHLFLIVSYFFSGDH